MPAALCEPIEQFDSDLHIADFETALNNIHSRIRDAAVDGSAAYESATRSFKLDLKGENFDVSRIRQISEGTPDGRPCLTSR